MVYAGILAGGLGKRMHRMDLPKQFLTLGTKPILIHTIEQFVISPQINQLIIVVPQEWRLYANDLLEKFFSEKQMSSIDIITGGANKTHTVKKLLDFIESKWELKDNDILLAHDAIRPFVTPRIIKENIETAIKYGAVNTVMGTTDTIIISQSGELIDSIPPKRFMFAEQTPQTFNIQLLKKIFSKVDEDTLLQEYELPRLVLREGYGIHLVRGEYSNMKIINPYDLEVANALLKEVKNVKPDI